MHRCVPTCDTQDVGVNHPRPYPDDLHKMTAQAGLPQISNKQSGNPRDAQQSGNHCDAQKKQAPLQPLWLGLSALQQRLCVGASHSLHDKSPLGGCASRGPQAGVKPVRLHAQHSQTH